MLDINLKGAWLVGRRIIPVMIGQKSGVIINNASIASFRGMNRLSHYAASKWGLTGLTKSWAIELAPYGIRVVSIHPTGVNTPMNESALPPRSRENAEGNRRGVRRQPAARAPWIEPEDAQRTRSCFWRRDKARFCDRLAIREIDAWAC